MHGVAMVARAAEQRLGCGPRHCAGGADVRIGRSAFVVGPRCLMLLALLARGKKIRVPRKKKRHGKN